MRRREFIAGLGGAAAWPLAALGQQGERVRRIGVLMTFGKNDPEAMGWLSGFTQELHGLGWSDGRNAQVEVRWAASNLDQMQMFAKQLVDLQPDVIVAPTTPATAALQRETRAIPILFAGISDPVGAGFVSSLSHPGGNLTGFVNMEAAMSSKWLELLTQIAPSVKRVAAMFNPDAAPGGGSYYLPSFEAAARLLDVEPIVSPVHSDPEIEMVMIALASKPGGGLVLMPDAFTIVHRATIILLAARNKLPAVYPISFFVRDGGLLSYGADELDIFRRAAPYVDRILRGAKPADLPVQLPIKFQMALNLKTTKALGLMVPQSIVLRADEVIE